MSNDLRPNPDVQNRMLKSQRLLVKVNIVSDADPASKTLNDDSSIATLRCEGQTAKADAKEDVSAVATTAADATGIFSVLIDEANVDQIYKVDLQSSSGTVALGAAGAVVTAGKRMLIDLDSSLDLSTAAGAVESEFTLVIDYSVSK